MVQSWITLTLELWNKSEYENYQEISIAGVDAPIRLLCDEPINMLGKTCSAHFVDLHYFTDKEGKTLCRIKCNACSKRKTRKLGTFPLENGKDE